ncbi:uncharacterized protein LOC112902168 [Panicum hallii]|nr:uncharacterized protein LOC112902168 [Panicum hallii]XP_025826880.1 uncharacterized protein LOC112902168 [Panicum hallii]XP_025826881.1 uncharacterized protein LOC112902168 [Panicum hallii]
MQNLSTWSLTLSRRIRGVRQRLIVTTPSSLFAVRRARTGRARRPPLLSLTSPSVRRGRPSPSCGSLSCSPLVDQSSLVWSRPRKVRRQRGERGSEMPHRARPMTGLLVFMGVNLVLVSTISPVYDFVCFHPYWERRRERRRREREAVQLRGSLKTTN